MQSVPSNILKYTIIIIHDPLYIPICVDPANTSPHVIRIESRAHSRSNVSTLCHILFEHFCIRSSFNGNKLSIISPIKATWQRFRQIPEMSYILFLTFSFTLTLSFFLTLSLFLSVFLLLNLDLPHSISCAREMHVIYSQQTWSLTRLTMQSINQNSLKNVYIKFPWELWHVVWISSTFSSDFGNSMHERRMQFVILWFVHPPRISSCKNSFGGLEILFRIFVSPSQSMP